MITPKNLKQVLETIEKAISAPPYTSTLREPFQVLVSTMISARTKDEVTEIVSRRIFSRIKEPEGLQKIPTTELEKLVRPANFYKNKSKSLKSMADTLVSDHGGKVPDTIDELVKLPGVGRKTANLVVLVAFGKPGVCVDTHVHRISNRWGLVKTKKPHETEMALRDKVPQTLWKRINALLVPFGKEVCRPISPLCSTCPLSGKCPRDGVKKHR